MKKRRFMISSLIMAGIAPVPSSQALDVGSLAGGSGPDPDDGQWVQRYAQDHAFSLAQHRSHSSHASHSSHRSGSSVRTPSARPRPPSRPRTTPAPAPSRSRNERSTPNSSVLPQSPATADNPFATGTRPSSTAVASLIRRVQIALFARGYYRGDIDEIVGRETRAALVKFQMDNSLAVTGTITPEVLDALQIVAE